MSNKDRWKQVTENLGSSGLVPHEHQIIYDYLVAIFHTLRDNNLE